MFCGSAILTARSQGRERGDGDLSYGLLPALSAQDRDTEMGIAIGDGSLNLNPAP
jgi:hypothetical protein